MMGIKWPSTWKHSELVSARELLHLAFIVISLFNVFRPRDHLRINPNFHPCALHVPRSAQISAAFSLSVGTDCDSLTALSILVACPCKHDAQSGFITL